MPNRVFSVTELNRFIQRLFESNPYLKRISVEGEITNLVKASSGHYYFSLKDSTSEVRCILWRSTVQNLKFDLRDGLNVKVNGAVQVYVQRGQYSIIVSSVQPVGIGTLYQIYTDRLKDYQDRGYFSSEIKKPLPENIKTVGVVTSESGAVIHDIITTVQRLDPTLEIVLIPALVQGEGAKESIAEGIKRFNELEKIDVIIVGRGGGSIEDLWAFNEPEVAEAIYNSRKPVISSVGHETDITISDLVADLRAPTPTAAAEFVSFGFGETLNEIEALTKRLNNIIISIYNKYTERINFLSQKIKHLSPENRIIQSQFKIDELDLKIKHIIEQKIERLTSKLEALKLKIELLNPESVLKRGFVMVTADDKLIKNVNQAKNYKTLDLHFYDGNQTVEVVNE